jgi:hypothetical protein
MIWDLAPIRHRQAHIDTQNKAGTLTLHGTWSENCSGSRVGFVNEPPCRGAGDWQTTAGR